MLLRIHCEVHLRCHDDYSFEYRGFSDEVMIDDNGVLFSIGCGKGLRSKIEWRFPFFYFKVKVI